MPAYHAIETISGHDNRGTPLLLWLIWTAAVVGAAFHTWYDTMRAEELVDLVRLVVRCTVVGLWGLVAITMLEIWLVPWRFIGE